MLRAPRRQCACYFGCRRELRTEINKLSCIALVSSCQVATECLFCESMIKIDDQNPRYLSSYTAEDVSGLYLSKRRVKAHDIVAFDPAMISEWLGTCDLLKQGWQLHSDRLVLWVCLFLHVLIWYCHNPLDLQEGFYSFMFRSKCQYPMHNRYWHSVDSWNEPVSAKACWTESSKLLPSSVASMCEYSQRLLRMPKNVPRVLQPSAHERSDGTGPINRNFSASMLLLSESARQSTPCRALQSGIFIYTTGSDCSNVHKYRESAPWSSSLRIYLNVLLRTAGVDDLTERRRSHKWEEKAAKRTPCNLTEASNEENEDGCHQLSSKVGLFVDVSISPESLGVPRYFTNAYPEYLRVPWDARECVPYAWWETTSGNGADPKQIQSVIDILEGMRVIRNHMVGRR